MNAKTDQFIERSRLCELLPPELIRKLLAHSDAVAVSGLETQFET